jgi:hypothetical protein
LRRNTLRFSTATYLLCENREFYIVNIQTIISRGDILARRLLDYSYLMNPLKLVFAAVLLAGSALVVRATPMLQLYDFDTGTTLTITDGDALDSFSAPGVIGYAGGLAGTVWDINLVGGISNGTPGNPHVHLNLLTHSSGAGGLAVSFLVDDLGPTAGNFLSAVGGVGAPGSSLNFLTATSSTNSTDFSADDFPIFQGPFTGAFSGADAAATLLGGPYSLIVTGYVEHSAAGTSSFDQDVTVPDGGASIALLGLALTGLGFFARRFKFPRA